MRVLIVEDDGPLAEALGAGLKRRGVACDHAAGIGDGASMLGTLSYDAVVLDLGLPDGDGVALVRDLRNRKVDVPILILSARSDVRARLDALDGGADDFVGKPFDMDELAARLRALTRRGRLGRFSQNVGNLELDAASGDVLVAGVAIDLSLRERQIVTLLMRRPGRTVAKQHVEDQLFGLSEPLSSNAIEVYVHRLRRKLERACASVSIQTVRGLGYVLRGPE